jgi:hypothetical protein
VRDPGAGAVKGYCPLRELGSNIEALRFYESLLNASPRGGRAALNTVETCRD